MNDDPGRLFDDPSLPEELRGALHDMAERPPEPYDVAAGLARFKDAMGPGGGSGEGSPPPGDGGTGAAGAGMGKATIIGAGSLGVIGVVAAIALVVGSRQQPVSPPAPAQVVTSAPTSVAAPPVETDPVPLIRPESLPTADPAARVVPSSAAVKSKGELYREELTHLAEVRRVAASNPARAVRMADEGHARYSGGMLYQEREAIAIRALAQSGQSGAARARGGQFLSRFPKSPFADQIRMTVGLSKP